MPAILGRRCRLIRLMDTDEGIGFESGGNGTNHASGRAGQRPSIVNT
ncbi:hypothetical protein [Kibdelosporangium philippinense]